MIDPVQLVSWINMAAGLALYFLAARWPRGFFSFQRPAYHAAQAVLGLCGIYVMYAVKLPAWVVFNIVWVGISTKTLICISGETRNEYRLET